MKIPRNAYLKLHIGEFGDFLLEKGDLDPIYIALHEVKLQQSQLHRWLLAYWAFYDAGAASYLSEFIGEGYWNAFQMAAENKPAAPAPIGAKNPINGGWPRGKERRHFRGAQAVRGYESLKTLYPEPELAIIDIAKEAFHTHVSPLDGIYRVPAKAVQPIPFATLVGRLKHWQQFGPWISFKIGDMLERCLGIPVEFDYDTVMYDTPREAALLQWKILHGVPREASIDEPQKAVREVVEHLVNHFGNHKAPPDFQRTVGMQEIETILCKWKSHMGGHYPLYNDIDEITHGVAPWAPTCHTAARFLDALPKRKDNNGK